MPWIVKLNAFFLWRDSSSWHESFLSTGASHGLAMNVCDNDSSDEDDDDCYDDDDDENEARSAGNIIIYTLLAQ